jgi:uncharacterized protein YeaO (DUF488 family)
MIYSAFFLFYNMEKSNYHELKLGTSFVTPQNMKDFPERGILPIFAIRNISNSNLIGGWQGTAVHFKALSPSVELLRQYRDGQIGWSEYKAKFTQEMSGLDFVEVLKRISFLCDLSGAKGAVLMGFGKDYTRCHRSVLAEIINGCGFLNSEVKEFIL